MKLNQMDNLNVVYDSMVFFKIMHWVQKAGKNEISGLGKVIKEGNKLKVIDAILLPQKNGAAHTDIEANDVGKAEFLLKDTPGELRLWWHSHVTMECFWSGTDTDTIEKLGKYGWILATVFNQHWKNRSAVFIGGDNEMFIDEIPFRHQFSLTDEMTAPWDKEFDENVKEERFLPVKNAHSYFENSLFLSARERESYRNWAKLAWKDLSAREKKLIAKSKKSDTVLALLETQHYGTVVYRIADNDLYYMYLTHKERPGLQERVMRFEILKDTLFVRYIRETFLSDISWMMLGTWREEKSKLSPFLEILESEEESNLRRLPPAKEEEEDTEEVKELPVNDRVLKSRMENLPIADVVLLKSQIPNWEELETDEKLEYLDIFESDYSQHMMGNGV